jgi:hypothetical protein
MRLRNNSRQTNPQGRRTPQTSTNSHATQPHQPLRGYKTKPITPPQSAGLRGLYRCIVDYNHQPFSITWSGPPEYPDLTTFPFLKNVEVSSVHQSHEIAAIWKDSTILDYGSHASIRITEHHRFPILKLAHPDDLSIKLIQHEFDILLELAKLGLPVVEIDQQPILDNGIACGYRMIKLSKLELSELQSRADDIKQILDRLHSAGFSHGDFSPSNILMDEDGHLVLIDFSFAGRVGSAVPSFFPSWVYTDGIYGIGIDLERFDRYIAPI